MNSYISEEHTNENTERLIDLRSWANMWGQVYYHSFSFKKKPELVVLILYVTFKQE